MSHLVLAWQARLPRRACLGRCSFDNKPAPSGSLPQCLPADHYPFSTVRTTLEVDIVRFAALQWRGARLQSFKRASGGVVGLGG